MPASTAQTVTSLASPALEHFVRGTLGCKCPDVVFQSITIDRADSHTRLVVGNRLLIYVFESSSGKTLALADAKANFAESVGDDDRAHLHVIAADQLPAELRRSTVN